MLLKDDASEPTEAAPGGAVPGAAAGAVCIELPAPKWRSPAIPPLDTYPPTGRLVECTGFEPPNGRPLGVVNDGGPGNAKPCFNFQTRKTSQLLVGK